jgi:Flp pilus assembly protein TadG
MSPRVQLRALDAATVGRRCPSDAGQVTLWMLAFSLAVLLLGLGVGVESWRVVSAWRNLAAAADAAAVAGASGIDEGVFRASGGQTIQLDPATAERLSFQNLDAQADREEIVGAEVIATTEQVTVEVRGEVDLFVLDALRGDRFQFTATATADPRSSP